MADLSDDEMRQMLTLSRDYCAVILRTGPAAKVPGAEKIVWEHARRNFTLRAQGILSVVCPIRDGSDVHGIGLFNGTPEAIRAVMDADPGVKAGVFTYELHPCRGFPGDSLPPK